LVLLLFLTRKSNSAIFLSNLNLALITNKFLINMQSLYNFFWQIIKPYKGYYALMFQAPIIAAFYVPLNNYVVKLLIDILATKPNFSFFDLFLPIALFVLGQFILEVAWRISNFAEYKSQPLLEAAIMKKAYEHILDHSYNFFQTNFAGKISSKINDLVESYKRIYEITHFIIISSLITCVVIIVALYLVRPVLAEFILVFSVVMFVVACLLSRKLNSLSQKYSQTKHKARGIINDGIANILSVKIFAAKEFEVSLVDKYLFELIEDDRVRMKFMFILHIVISVIYVSISIILLFLLLNLKKRNLITIGDFALVFGLVFYLMEIIFRITHEFSHLVKALGEMRAAFDILKLEPQVKDIKNALELEIDKGKIEFKNIIFEHDHKKKFFNDFSLIIKPGQKIGLVGESGSGKTTLINLLLRYFEVNQGEILIDGQNINYVTQESLRRNISLIPQDTNLFHRSIAENIGYAKPGSSIEEIIEAAKKAHAHNFITSLTESYETIVGERGTKLSGGQRQRIAIARAILKDSKILILDEATSALDSKTENEIQDSLNLLISAKDKTVIAIAHRLFTLKNMDKIIVLDKGRMAEIGSHEELLLKEDSLYKGLWELQRI
jgi:ATP-binding cassette subfamily B protein